MHAGNNDLQFHRALLKPQSYTSAVLPLRPKTEKLIVLVYIFMACLTLAHASYYAYSSYYEEIHSVHRGLTQDEYYRLHATIALSAEHPLFSGTDHAPNQYRVGVVYPAKFLADHLSIHKYYIVFVGLDFIAAIAICYLLYLQICGSVFFRDLNPGSRTTVVALFLASLVFPFAWVVPWQRPETLPSGLYLALVIMLLSRLRSNRLWLVAILLATFWQGFIRADVAAMFGLALVLFSFNPRAKHLFGARRLGMITGLLIAAIAIADQAYLEMFLFPHARYAPDTPVMQFFLNLKLRTLITFAIGMLPYLATLALGRWYRNRLDDTDILAIIASCVYLPLWWTVGILGEVRVFVPFLLVLTPTATKLLFLLLERKEQLA